MTARKALIIGASRGLGLGLVNELVSDGWQVTATVRDLSKADNLNALKHVQIEQLDIDDLKAIKEKYGRKLIISGVCKRRRQRPGRPNIRQCQRD